MFKIIDNFLDDDKFNQISHLVKSSDFHWNLTSILNKNSNDGDWQGVYKIIEEGRVVTSTYKFMVDDLVKSLQKIYRKSVSVSRFRVNLFGKYQESRGLGYHKDVLDGDYLSLLLYLENSNGKTEFKNVQMFNGMKMKTVDSFANRALIFPSHCEHQTLTQTDVTFRTNINMNFVFDDN
jgi:hypothetical protein